MKKSIAFLIICVLYLFPNWCFALVSQYDNFYVNNNGVKMTIEQYNSFVELGYDEREIEEFSAVQVEQLKEFKVDSSSSITAYYKDVYIYDDRSSYDEGKVINVLTNEITKSEYEQGVQKNGLILQGETFNNAQILSLNLKNNYYETTYKKITLTITKDLNVATKRRVSVLLTWKQMPKVRSYDIIAMRVDKSTGDYFEDGTQSGVYNYTISSAPDCNIGNDTILKDTFNNSSSSWNKKALISGVSYYGVGLTHELASDRIACYNDALLAIKAPIKSMSTSISSTASTPNVLTVYASYQHASSSVDFNSVAKKYDFSTNGLGKVILFNNGMGQYYDGMGGVSLSY